MCRFSRRCRRGRVAGAPCRSRPFAPPIDVGATFAGGTPYSRRKARLKGRIGLVADNPGRSARAARIAATQQAGGEHPCAQCVRYCMGEPAHQALETFGKKPIANVPAVAPPAPPASRNGRAVSCSAPQRGADDPIPATPASQPVRPSSCSLMYSRRTSMKQHLGQFSPAPPAPPDAGEARLRVAR